MIGQWIGQTEGTNKGFVEINIEGLVVGYQDVFGARVLFTDQDNSNVNFYCVLQFKKTGNQLKGVLFDFFIFDYLTKQLIGRDRFQEMYPKSNIPVKGEVTGTIEEDVIRGVWETNIGTKGGFTVTKSQVEKESKADYVMSTWDDFIKWLSEDSKSSSGRIYRGQRTQKRLRTTFSRNNRSDLINYAQTDIKTLVHHINAVSEYVFDLDHKAKDYYALLNLAQHHGYPTPLLDWTESPYVAAYFAYHEVEKEKRDGYVRIFVFDSIKWKERCPQLVNIFDPRLSITIDIFPIINNRALPQQSVSALSNVDDIEGFIQLYESIFKEKYLVKIDLPIFERNRVMKELQPMGITAAALFPGFDGICKYLRERYF